MTITANYGPLISIGQPPVVNGMPQGYNEDAATSLAFGGWGILDPRYGYFGEPGNRRAIGFGGMTNVPLIDQVPTALAAANIVAAAVPVVGTAMTLAGASTGITVVPVGTQLFPSGVTISAGLVLDVLATQVAFGQSSAIQLYDPTKSIARNVRLTSVGNDSTATFVVRGYDLFGYAMSETITGANIGIASGKKAFKIIVSVTPAGTLSGSTVSVGTGDVFGFPMRVDAMLGYTTIVWNGAVITATTGFLAAVTTSPATSLTGDVRGTYAVQTASDSAKRLLVFATPAVANLGSAVGIFGVVQA